MCEYQTKTCPGVAGPPPNGREKHGNGVHIVKYCPEYDSDPEGNVFTHKHHKKLDGEISEYCGECAGVRPSRQRKSKFSNHPTPYQGARKIRQAKKQVRK